MRTLLMLPLCAGLFAADATRFPCEPPSEVQHAIEAILAPAVRRQQREAFDQLLARHPDDLFVRERAMLIRFVPESRRRQALAELAVTIQHNPSDAFAHYLNGRMHHGHETPLALAELTQALQSAPGLARAHLVLARIYEAPNFRDPARRNSHLRAFLDACPADAGGYQLLAHIAQPDLAAAYAPGLRRIAEQRSSPALYRALWSIEAQAGLAPRVVADLKRIESMPGAGRDREGALAAGYHLLGNDAEARKHAPVRPAPPPAQAKLAEWTKAHPAPDPPDPAYLRARNRAIQELLKLWPDDVRLHSDRLGIARQLEDLPAAEIADGLLAALERDPDARQMTPYRLDVRPALRRQRHPPRPCPRSG